MERLVVDVKVVVSTVVTVSVSITVAVVGSGTLDVVANVTLRVCVRSRVVTNVTD